MGILSEHGFPGGMPPGNPCLTLQTGNFYFGTSGDYSSGTDKHRGKRSNRAFAPSLHRTVVGLIKERYADFGPTLACENLAALHGHRLSSETLRKWMIAEGLWKPKRRRQARIHQRRARPSLLGRDGSDGRFAARLVRGSCQAVYPDRVH